MLVLKKPKTISSIRRVFLPKTVAEMLVAWKMEQNTIIETIGNEYTNFNLVIATPYGMPTEAAVIRRALKGLIEKNNLPPVVFHSLRHSSTTYKLKLNGGDIKAVQGDSGHAQATMVTDRYSHIFDDHRRKNAQLMEKAFYSGNGPEPNIREDNREITALQQPKIPGISQEQVTKTFSNPDSVKIIQMLLQTIGI